MKIFFTDSAGATQEIVFDASVSEDHGASAEATKHPMESGSQVTDHVIEGAPTLKIEGVISNHPITQPASNMRGVTSQFRALELGQFPTRTMTQGAQGGQAAEWTEGQTSGKATVLQFSGPFDRVGDVHKALLELRRGQVVTVVTSLITYERMQITEINVPRTVESGNSATFSLAFEQLSFADSATVDVPAPSQPRGNAGANRGNQPGGDSASGEGRQSLLQQGVNAVRERLGL